jgi:hypothetical protein
MVSGTVTQISTLPGVDVRSMFFDAATGYLYLTGRAGQRLAAAQGSLVGSGGCVVAVHGEGGPTLFIARGFGRPDSVMVANGAVFWTDMSQAAQGSVWGQDLDRRPIEIAAGQPAPMLIDVDGGFLWWQNRGALRLGARLPSGIVAWNPTDGARTVFSHDERAVTRAVRLGDAIHWFGEAPPDDPRRFPLRGTTAHAPIEPLLTEASRPLGLAVRRDELLWLRAAGAAFELVAFRPGATPRVVAELLAEPTAGSLRVSGERAHVAVPRDDGYEIHSCTLDDAGPARFALLATGLLSSDAFAAGESQVFVAGAEPGSILAVSIA